MLYPLRFRPVFQRYLWGGHRLRDVLGKPTGSEPCAESWEIADHHENQSRVENGPLAGMALGEVMDRHGQELLGPDAWKNCIDERIPDGLRGRFPLLLKFLDAHRDLSVQVHPDDSMAATLSPPDLGKTEAWYVVAADPGSRIYAGLKPGIGPREFRQAIEQGRAAETLHQFQPKPGDCVLIRAGTVHAIGAGLLICEIQQASNTTFRLFDWNRVDADGRPRPLHIEQGIAATDFGLGPVQPVSADAGARSQTLVDCDKFVLRRYSISRGESATLDQPPRQMRIATVVQGAVVVESDAPPLSLGKGQTVLIPASVETSRLRASGETPTIVLEILLSSGLMNR